MISKTEFLSRIKILEGKSIKSKTGKASYSNLLLINNVLSFKRDATKVNWGLNVDELFIAYKKENFLNTVILRQYLSNRVYSPGMAVLIAIKACELSGERLIS